MKRAHISFSLFYLIKYIFFISCCFYFIICTLSSCTIVRQKVTPPIQLPEITYPDDHWERIPNPESIGYSSSKLNKLNEYIHSLNTTGLMVIVGGRILFEYGNVKELSFVASVRKSILSMLYGKYIANGTIQLDKTLKEIPLMDIGGLFPIERQATIRHLLTARSGVYHRASNTGDYLNVAPARGTTVPGTCFLYNNWDFNAAGAVFEKLTGMNIYEAIQKDVADPISMQDFDIRMQQKRGDSKKSKFLAYHLWLSTRDMARIGYLMLRKGRWKDKQVIPTDWVDQIVSVVTPSSEMSPSSIRSLKLGYGYMWWIWEGNKNQGLFKGAYTAQGAFGQYITVIPLLDMVVAHKTAVDPFTKHLSKQKRKEISTRWKQYMNILELLRSAAPVS